MPIRHKVKPSDRAAVSAAAGVILKDEVVLTGATAGTFVGIVDGAGTVYVNGVLDYDNVYHSWGVLDQWGDYRESGIYVYATGYHPSGMIDDVGDYYESGTLDAEGNHTPLP